MDEYVMMSVQNLNIGVLPDVGIEWTYVALQLKHTFVCDYMTAFVCRLKFTA